MHNLTGRIGWVLASILVTYVLIVAALGALAGA
jgi:hypothetical protein